MADDEENPKENGAATYNTCNSTQTQSLAFNAVITELKDLYCVHGIPDVPQSENGPQFSASEFKSFADIYGFKHVYAASKWRSGTCRVNREEDSSTKEFRSSYIKLQKYIPYSKRNQPS